MSVAPLFLVDMDALRGRLRLGGVGLDDAAKPLIDSATRVVRTNFYTRLGVTRVAELLAFTSIDNPTTNDEIIRSLAEEIESKWVWVELTRTLPIKFFDNSGDDLEAYNTEAAFRSIDPDRISVERDRCLVQIENWLPLLAGEVELGAVDSAKVFTQSKMAGGRPFPLGTLIGQNAQLYGDPGRFTKSDTDGVV